ncbi:lysophospholipid acyltransferase family protein [Anaeromyxobacter oryzae]|uniref:Lipid A biosynthesis lauroyl acyltransferase n=1 Tax=Anaeromyxobacter oryzae TaxID=2918170 RepID=A0ABM7X2N7_9BACT|nr:lysophospholipid acyltransferase family protein [Anaeromyxobacter oryzae]BDG06056.1 lipid A biosynthesis lauroyl acyltransferase [Anaeromyxobacter oryzae]
MRLLGWLLVRIPHRWLMAAGAALGALLWGLGIRRKVVLDNLRLAFPEKTEEERRTIARSTYRNLGQIVPDFLRVPALPKAELERIFVYDGWDAYERARALGKGVIACTAHFGNFDLLAAAHTLRGVPITMISRQMGKSGANDLWRSARKRAGVEDLVVGKGNVLQAATRSLKAGRTLGYVIDQNQPGRSAIFPTFFGVPAATAPTPALLARRTGAAVVFCLSVPLGDGRHQVIIEGPLSPPDTGDRDRDALLFMQDLNDRLERWVRAFPDRWYWLHRRWKRRGDAPVAAPAALTPEDAAR